MFNVKYSNVHMTHNIDALSVLNYFALVRKQMFAAIIITNKGCNTNNYNLQKDCHFDSKFKINKNQVISSLSPDILFFGINTNAAVVDRGGHFVFLLFGF